MQWNTDGLRWLTHDEYVAFRYLFYIFRAFLQLVLPWRQIFGRFFGLHQESLFSSTWLDLFLSQNKNPTRTSRGKLSNKSDLSSLINIFHRCAVFVGGHGWAENFANLAQNSIDGGRFLYAMKSHGTIISTYILHSGLLHSRNCCKLKFCRVRSTVTTATAIQIIPPTTIIHKLLIRMM